MMNSPDRDLIDLTEEGAGVESAESQGLDSVQQRSNRSSTTVRESPDCRTFMGIHKYDHELGDLARISLAKRRLGRRTIEAGELDPRRLSQDCQVERAVLLGMLRNEVMESEVVRRHETDQGSMLLP